MKSKRKNKIKIVERKLGRERAWGQIHMDGKLLIEIDPRQNKKKYLNTLVHELLHAAYEDMSESDVLHGARKLTTYLWDTGYRRIKLL